ncbi:hypothetical protein [Halalkalicoccus salilacus]|uniref:hypothetical protein n=1 Tax=Halalkalicoccus sp. GCM10025704 TaxID=3252662 RepID=UPI003617663C
MVEPTEAVIVVDPRDVTIQIRPSSSVSPRFRPSTETLPESGAPVSAFESESTAGPPGAVVPTLSRTPSSVSSPSGVVSTRSSRRVRCSR